jgi:hypothetical protein
MVAALGSRLEIQVELLEPGQCFGIAVLDGPGREFPREKGLADKDVTDVVSRQRDDDIAAAGLELYQPLGAQFQQPFAHRSGADAQVLRDRLGADEIPPVEFAGDDQVAYVRSGLGPQLRAMATVIPRSVGRLLGRLGEGSGVPGNGLSTTLWSTCGHGKKPRQD